MKVIEMFSHVVKFGAGSSTHHPERNGGMSTCDIQTWICYDGTWFIPLIRSQGRIWDDLQKIKSSQELEAYIERIKG